MHKKISFAGLMAGSITAVLILWVFVFSPHPVSAVAGVITPSSAKSGEVFEVNLGSSLTVSPFGNIINYYDSQGVFIVRETGISAALDSETQTSVVSSVFPVLNPGQYYLTVVNANGLTSDQNFPFTILPADKQLKPVMIIGAKDPGLQEIGREKDSLVFIVLNEFALGASDVKVYFDNLVVESGLIYGMTVIAEIPENLTGSVQVKIQINNYISPVQNLNIQTFNFKQTSPAENATLKRGETYQISWEGGKIFSIFLLQGSEQVIDPTDPATGKEYTLNAEHTVASSPFSWTVPSFLEDGADYRFLPLFGTSDTVDFIDVVENPEKYAETQEQIAIFVSYAYGKKFKIEGGTFDDSSLPQDFGPVTVDWEIAAHLPGTLVNQDGAIFQVVDGGKMLFPSVPVFRSYGHQFYEAVPATPGDRNLPYVGKFIFADGSLMADQGTVYILYRGQKYGFVSREVFEGLGYKFSNVYPGDLSEYALGGVISNVNAAHSYGTLVNIDGAIYITSPYSKTGIPSMNVAKSNKLFLEWAVPANAADRQLPDNTKLSFAEGSLVSANGVVYYIGGSGIKTGFPSAEIFTKLGYQLSNVIPVSAEEIAGFEEIDLSFVTDLFNRVFSVSSNWSYDQYVSARDALRLSQVRQTQTALELYFNDNNAYPATLQELSPLYLTSIPQTPLPPDGVCSYADNEYLYSADPSGSYYTLNFCTGGAVGGYAGGNHVASPSGIE